MYALNAPEHGSSLAGLPLPPTPQVLSTEDRDVWAKTRAKMMADPANATALKAVDQGIIAVCLDEDSVSDMSWIGQSILCGPAEVRARHQPATGRGTLLLPHECARTSGSSGAALRSAPRCAALPLGGGPRSSAYMLSLLACADEKKRRERWLWRFRALRLRKPRVRIP